MRRGAGDVEASDHRSSEGRRRWASPRHGDGQSSGEPPNAWTSPQPVRARRCPATDAGEAALGRAHTEPPDLGRGRAAERDGHRAKARPGEVQAPDRDAKPSHRGDEYAGLTRILAARPWGVLGSSRRAVLLGRQMLGEDRPCGRRVEADRPASEGRPSSPRVAPSLPERGSAPIHRHGPCERTTTQPGAGCGREPHRGHRLGRSVGRRSPLARPDASRRNGRTPATPHAPWRAEVTSRTRQTCSHVSGSGPSFLLALRHRLMAISPRSESRASASWVVAAGVEQPSPAIVRFRWECRGPLVTDLSRWLTSHLNPTPVNTTCRHVVMGHRAVDPPLARGLGGPPWPMPVGPGPTSSSVGAPHTAHRARRHLCGGRDGRTNPHPGWSRTHCFGALAASRSASRQLPSIATHPAPPCDLFHEIRPDNTGGRPAPTRCHPPRMTPLRAPGRHRRGPWLRPAAGSTGASRRRREARPGGRHLRRPRSVPGSARCRRRRGRSGRRSSRAGRRCPP